MVANYIEVFLYIRPYQIHILVTVLLLSGLFFLTYEVSEGPRAEEVISNALGITLISFF